MDMSMGSRFKRAWNTFFNRDPTHSYNDTGPGYFYRPDRTRFSRGNERSIVTSVYNRISLDGAAISIQHVRLDENERYVSNVSSELNNCLTLEANLDQTARAFRQDVIMSMLDEGCIAIVPVETTDNPEETGGYDILSMRVGKILEWYPQHVKVRVYNEWTGEKQDIKVPKSTVAIVENPLYAVINEPNSTMQRLIRKLNLLDVVDEQSSSGKLDLIIQLPYVIKTEARRQQAENRRKDIENQLSGSKYGIAYTDGRGQGASGIVTKRKDSNVLYAVLQVQSGDTVNEVVYPMLNLGKSPLPYKPYQGSVTPLPIPRPLHKVGDVRDICCTRVKSVYDKRIVIDQNSIINMSGEASIVGTSRRFNVPAEDIPITNDAVIEPVRCNILPARPSGGVSGTYALDAPGISLQNNQSVSQPNINIRVPGCKTLEEIKAWLTDNPLTVYYQSTSYNGANGLDICLTEYQNGSIELDGTESNLQFFSEYQTLAIKGITTAGDPSQANAYGVCISSHFALVPPGTSTTLDKVVYGQPQYNQIIIHDTSWNSLETAKAYLAAQKAAGTPVQIAYQLATPEVYATDPVDFDNAAGPLTVLTGGELEAAFKSADKVVESRIDFVEDTLNEQGQAIAEKAPISHSSDKSTYGLGSGSQFGHVKLSDATASGSNAGQGIAATPSAVNQVNARVSTVDGIARAAMPKSGGTFTGNVLASSANEAGAFLRNISVQNSASQLQYTNFIIMVRK